MLGGVFINILLNKQFDHVDIFIYPMKKYLSSHTYFSKKEISKKVSRNLISNLLQLSNVDFLVNNYGKPYLKSERLFFNISHSENYLVIATSLNLELGIDIEEKDIELEYERLKKNVLTKKEYSEISIDNKFDFLQIWTRKESVLKAIGKGLLIPPTTIDVFLKENVQVNYHDSINKTSYKVYVQNVNLDYKILCSLATLNKKPKKITCHYLNIDTLS